MSKVLVLGAGLVSRPLVRYLLDKGHTVTCASRTVAKAEALSAAVRPSGRQRRSACRSPPGVFGCSGSST